MAPVKHITTPFGRTPVSEDGERMLEQAIQTGERYSFKLENGRGEPVTLSGYVRRSARSSIDYILDTGAS